MSDAREDRRATWALAAAGALLLLVGLGWTDVSAPDEPRYVQVAEEMRALEQGPVGLVLLHLNGEPYTQKPPLYYGLAALFGAPFGRVSEAAARLPSALAGLASVLLVAGLGARMFGRTTGLVGAALLLTTFEFATLSRRVQLDVLLTLFELGALLAFWAVDRGRLSRSRGAVLFHTCMGLAVLTKGPVGLILPCLSVLGYLAWERRLRDARCVFPWWGWLLSAAPGIAWISGATLLAPSGFADDAVATNLIGRFFAGTSHERPIYYYLYQLPVDFLPWTLLLPLVAWTARRRVLGAGRSADPARARAWRFLLAWVGASLLFFTLSSGKRGLYMLPAFPALALLCADATVLFVRERARMPKGLDVAIGVFASLLAAVGVAAIAVAAGLPGAPTLEWVEELRIWAEAVHAPLLASFGIGVLASLGIGWVAWRRLARSGAAPLWRVAVAIAGAWAIEACVFAFLHTALDPIRSPRPIAEAASQLVPAGERIALFRDKPMIGGLAYYGNRRVAVCETPEDVAQYAADGGRAIVLKSRKLDRVVRLTPVQVVARVRPGRREVLVAAPASAPPGGAGSGSPGGD